MENNGIHAKFRALTTRLQSLQNAALAFSGGVDSTFLLKVANEILGNRLIAVTARSSTYPERELREACEYAAAFGVKHIIIESEELDIQGFSDNPINRCYFCKNELFSKIRELANQNGIQNIMDGCNSDDVCDYRPGMQAAGELGVLSPLKDAGLSKEDIRALSKEMGLSTWDKQAFACLSSRFPYGHKITREKLAMVDQAEQLLLDMGFRNVRVRHHGDIARIEVAAHERVNFFDPVIMDSVDRQLKEIGFVYSALDLKGYRTGSMNEGLLEISRTDENVSEL